MIEIATELRTPVSGERYKLLRDLLKKMREVFRTSSKAEQAAVSEPVDQQSFYENFAALDKHAQTLLGELEFVNDEYDPMPWQEFLKYSLLNKKISAESMDQALQELMRAGLVVVSNKKSLFPENGTVYDPAPGVSESMHKLGLAEIPDGAQVRGW